jgi:hypothetical protein
MALFNYHIYLFQIYRIVSMIKKNFHLFKNFLFEKVNIYNIQILVFN